MTQSNPRFPDADSTPNDFGVSEPRYKDYELMSDKEFFDVMIERDITIPW